MTLKGKCKERGLTLTDLAKTTKITVDYLSKLNTRKRNNPTLDVAEKISKALGITIDELNEALKN